MPSISSIVQDFVRAQFPRGGRMGVAVSGGADSVALLDALHALAGEMRLELVVLHFDHGLRAESAVDAGFVRSLAAARGLTYDGEKSETPITGGSIEEKARRVRYGFFARAASRQRLAAVATAHTADDQAETVLLRLFRGSGSRGLAGIPPVRREGDLLYLRPLLTVRRDEVERYILGRNLAYRSDPSNDSLAFSRNRIRRQILPFLKEHGNPQIVEMLCRTGEILRQEQEWLEGLEASALEAWEFSGKRYSCACAGLRRLPAALLARSFIALLARLDAPVSFELVEALCALVREGGRLDITGALAAWTTDDDRIVLGSVPLRPVAIAGEFEIAGSGVTEIPALGMRIRATPQISTPVVKELSIRRPPPQRHRGWSATAFIDAAAVSGRLFVRTRREGDRLQPFGMKGTKKLHDLFIDEKISLLERDQWPILCDEKGLLWVIGVKQDERTRVGPGTERVLRFDVTTEPEGEGPEQVA